MKRITFLKSLFLLCALVVGSSSVWAEDSWIRTAPADLQTGDIIVVVDLSSSMAMSNTEMNSKTAPLGVAVTLKSDNTEITSTVGTDLQWTLSCSGTGGERTYQLAKNSTSKLVVTADNNGVRVNNGVRNTFLVTTGGNNNGYYLNNTATEGTGNKAKTVTRYIGCYYDEQNTRYDWRCYTSINANIAGNNIQFYKKVAATTHEFSFSSINGTITATDTDNNTVATGSQVAESEPLTVTATPSSGYKFKQWSVSGTGSSVESTTTNPTTFTMGTADATLTAEFEEDITDYSIILNQTTGGTIDASSTTATSGTEITLTATPNTGYRFISWTVLDEDLNEVVVTNNKFTMPASNVEIEGTFAQEYTITINDAENGSVAADPTAGIAGETITLTATPTGYYVLNTITVKDADNDDVEVSGTGNTRSFTMPAKAVTVTAAFNIPKGSFVDPYTVAEVWEMYNANNSISVEGWVTGYIVGSVPQSNQAIATTSGHSTTTLALMDTPTISNPSTKVEDRTDLLVIQMASSNIISTNNNVSAHPEHIGKLALIKGTIKKYYGIAGVNPSTIIKISNMMTLNGTINSTADIPGYTDDGSMVYYVKTNEKVNAKNVVHENSGATTLTIGEYVLSDEENIYIPYDITAEKVTNNRTLTADVDAYTWYEPYAYTLPTGNTAYTFTGANGSALTFTETGSQILTANTPYLIIAGNDVNGSMNSSVTVKATPSTNTSGGTQGDWQFVGTYKSMTAAEAAAEDMWALGSSNKWKYYTGTDVYGVYPRRCYMINSTNKSGGPSAKLFDTVFGGETTYIELINKQNPEESRIYTLEGKYVGTKKEVLKSGIYVSNGKKIMVK